MEDLKVDLKTEAEKADDTTTSSTKKKVYSIPDFLNLILLGFVLLIGFGLYVDNGF